MSTATPGYPELLEDVQRRPLKHLLETSDYIFRTITRIGGFIVLAVMCLVGLFLSINAVQAVSAVGLWKFLTTQEWAPETNNFGIAALLAGTIMVAAVALIVSIPLSIGTALFITEIARGPLQKVLTSAIDLMAAVPSVVFGLWGAYMLQPNVVGFSQWLSEWFGWIPVFNVRDVDPNNPLIDTNLYTASTFIAGLVVSMMVIPLQTAMMTEAFRRAPAGEREGAFALGATRWGMIRSVVLPFGKGGIIGGTMLGMGRALGETIAVYLIISPKFVINPHILENGSNTVAAHIALRYGEANDFSISALMAAGLALFALTMVVNFTASAIIARSRSGADSEG